MLQNKFRYIAVCEMLINGCKTLTDLYQIFTFPTKWSSRWIWIRAASRRPYARFALSVPDFIVSAVPQLHRLPSSCTEHRDFGVCGRDPAEIPLATQEIQAVNRLCKATNAKF